MSSSDWETLKEEIYAYLAIGHATGDADLDTITLLVWLERRKIAALSDLLRANNKDVPGNI